MGRGKVDVGFKEKLVWLGRFFNMVLSSIEFDNGESIFDGHDDDR